MHSPPQDSPLATEWAAQRNYLLRYARSRLRDAATAEDVVQDTLLAALQSLARFEQRASLRTWLTGILINKIADAVRRDRRGGLALAVEAAAGGAQARGRGDESGAQGDRMTNEPADEPAEELADFRDPERVLAGRQAAHALLRRLDDLAPLAQRVFLLREIEGLDNGEAARELGLTPERGALLLHRTRARLRRGLREAQVL